MIFRTRAVALPCCLVLVKRASGLGEAMVLGLLLAIFSGAPRQTFLIWNDIDGEIEGVIRILSHGLLNRQKSQCVE